MGNTGQCMVILIHITKILVLEFLLTQVGGGSTQGAAISPTLMMELSHSAEVQGSRVSWQPYDQIWLDMYGTFRICLDLWPKTWEAEICMPS